MSGRSAWRAKAHVLWADQYAMRGNTPKASAHLRRAMTLLRFGGDHNKPCCTICLDSEPPPIQSGCACRSDTGLAHVGCLVEKAVAQQPHRGNMVWWKCQTCGQNFTGAMQTGLAEAWWARVRDEAEESGDRLQAAHTLALARDRDGAYAEAERIHREVLDVQRRVLGDEHRNTLIAASSLASSLSYQGKHVQAERIQRELLGAKRRALGEGHLSTLMSAADLAATLLCQAKYAEAEQIQRDALGVMRRVLGEEHPDTLNVTNNLAMSLAHQG